MPVHTTIVWPERVEIPGELPDVEAFRRWVRSDDFPERGRIDWIAGTLEVDMSPEDLNTHATAKAAIARVLGRLVEEGGRGFVAIDAMRYSNAEADLSVEPDVIVLLYDSIEAGLARLVPKASEAAGRYVEIEGAVDLVVECLSDGSVGKDRDVLPARYHAAGVREYWLVDARPSAPELLLHARSPDGFLRVTPDADGYVRSEVLETHVRLERAGERAGVVTYRLVSR